jgi:hypothetical protein
MPRQLLDRIIDLLDNPVRGPVVRMKMPNRGDYGVYWEMDGGYDFERALVQAVAERVHIELIKGDLQDLQQGLDA